MISNLVTLDATIAHLTTNDILKESCDDAVAGGAQCNHDQVHLISTYSLSTILTPDPANLQGYLDKARPILSRPGQLCRPHGEVLPLPRLAILRGAPLRQERGQRRRFGVVRS